MAKMGPVEVMEKAAHEAVVWVDHRDYPEAQLRYLLERIPQLMHALLTQDKAELDSIAGALDGYCWHIPSCEAGERCNNAEPNQEQRYFAGVEQRPAEEAD